MAYRVYISASTQKENVGVGSYGTEQDRMMQLADRVKYWLKTQGKFEVFRNQPGYTLSQTVNDCNNLACELFIDNHTNAGPASVGGTEVFYNHKTGTTSKGYKIADLLYKYIALLSPGKDRGVLPDNRYVGSLFVIQKTTPPAALIEHIFHTNLTEVNDFLHRLDEYAKAEAKAVCEYFNEKWIEPQTVTPLPPIANLVQELSKTIVIDKAKWIEKGTKDMDVYYLIKKFVEAKKGA